MGEFVIGIRVQIFHVAGIGRDGNVRLGFNSRVVPLIPISDR
jgi:hypothetical protein